MRWLFMLPFSHESVTSEVPPERCDSPMTQGRSVTTEVTAPILDGCFGAAYTSYITLHEGPLRTTLNLDHDLVAAVMKATQAKSKTEAITMAMTELVRRRKLDKLKALSGTIRLESGWKKRESAELKRQTTLRRRWHGHR